MAHHLADIDDEDCFLRDRKSANKTRIGTKELKPEKQFQISNGKEIFFGQTKCIFEKPEESSLVWGLLLVSLFLVASLQWMVPCDDEFQDEEAKKEQEEQERLRAVEAARQERERQLDEERQRAAEEVANDDSATQPVGTISPAKRKVAFEEGAGETQPVMGLASVIMPLNMVLIRNQP